MAILRFRGRAVEWREDKELASRLADGDEQAVSRFMDIYAPRLYRFAMVRLGHDEMAAEDVVQQTLTIAARRISTYRAEASLMTWLTSICMRELVRYRNERGVREKVIMLFDDEQLMRSLFDTLETPDTDEPFVYSERAELVDLVHYVLDNLPNRYGDVLEWKYIEGLNLDEIGRRLGVGREAVQSRLARARRSFKKAFGEVWEIHCGKI